MDADRFTAETFYSNYIGRYPFSTDREWLITQGTINHLYDSNISNTEMLEIFEYCSCVDVLNHESLPDTIWENSLTKRNKWYYHRELQLRSKECTFDPINGVDIRYPYYVEIKSRYTEEELYKYAMSKLGSFFSQITDKNKDIATLKYFIKKYDSFDYINGLDFTLCLIDCCSDKNEEVGSILEIDQCKKEVYERLVTVASEAYLHNANRVIWRYDAV